MKRVLVLALAALFLFSLSRSSADYIVIKIDVTKNYIKSSGLGQPNKLDAGVGGGGFRGGQGPGLGQGGNTPGVKPPQGGAPQGGAAGQQQGAAAADLYQPRWVYAYLELRGNPRLHYEQKKNSRTGRDKEP